MRYPRMAWIRDARRLANPEKALDAILGTGKISPPKRE
jgi:hypothetical protein